MAKLFANDTIGPLYAEQLQKEHSGSKWGSTGARYSGKFISEVISTRPYLETALDYGAGKRTLSESLPELKWTNYDPGIPEIAKKPSPGRRFDLVTCTDVLEHIEPDLLEGVLKELGEYTNKVLVLDIACYLTGKTFGEGPYKGQDLHLIVEPPEWWKEQLEANIGLQFAEGRAIDKLSKGRVKTRYQVVYERV